MNQFKGKFAYLQFMFDNMVSLQTDHEFGQGGDSIFDQRHESAAKKKKGRCFVIFFTSNMKHHPKQNSLQFKPVPSNYDPYIHKTQVIANTYRKKTQTNDTSPIFFHYNTPSTLNRSTNRQNKKSLSKNAEHRSIQKKSQGKLLNEKSIERLRTIYKPVGDINTIGIKAKLVKITHILMVKIQQQVKDTLSRVYEANEEYNTLLKEWKRLEIYDETDELIKRVIDNYTDIIEDLMSKSLNETISTIDRYETQLTRLTKENGKLKYLLELQTNKLEAQMLQLQSRVHQQYQKNQWNTYLFNQLSLQPFDLQSFIKSTQIYSKAKSQYTRNNYFRQSHKSRKEHHQQPKQDTFLNKQLCQSQYLESKATRSQNPTKNN